MIIGAPKELLDGEARVALTPDSASPPPALSLTE